MKRSFAKLESSRVTLLPASQVSARVSCQPDRPQSKVSVPGRFLAASRATTVPVRFEFHNPNARHVFVAGSFNGWNPSATGLVRLGGGHWVRFLWLPPGAHEYLFVADGVWFFDPHAKEYVANVYGTRNAVVKVEKPTRQVNGHSIRTDATASGVEIKCGSVRGLLRHSGKCRPPRLHSKSDIE